MLTGGLPGSASTALPSDVEGRVSRRWNPLLARLLARDPAVRLADCAAAEKALNAILRAAAAAGRSREVAETVRKGVLPACFLTACLLAALSGLRRIQARMAAQRAAIAEREERERQAQRAYEESFGYFAAMTNGVVWPVKGGVLRLDEGRTAIVYDVLHTRKGSPPREPVQKIVLNGGRLVFSRPYERLLSLLETMAVEKNRRKIGEHSLGLHEIAALDPWNAEKEGCQTLDIPIEVTAKGGVIEADGIEMLDASVKGPITAADGSAEVLFKCVTPAVIDVFQDALGPGVSVATGSVCKIMDNVVRNGRNRVVKWYRPLPPP